MDHPDHPDHHDHLDHLDLVNDHTDHPDLPDHPHLPDHPYLPDHPGQKSVQNCGQFCTLAMFILIQKISLWVNKSSAFHCSLNFHCSQHWWWSDVKWNQVVAFETFRSGLGINFWSTDAQWCLQFCWMWSSMVSLISWWFSGRAFAHLTICHHMEYGLGGQKTFWLLKCYPDLCQNLCTIFQR